MKIRYFPISPDKPDTLVSANDGKLKVHGMTTVCVSIGGYVCDVDFLVVDDLNVNCILGLSMLKANQADVKLSNSTLSLQNGLTAVPLITRFSKSNILRTIHAITVEPLCEIQFPVRIHNTYKLQPSIVEQLPGRLNAKVGVAKIYVEPKSRTTICQIVNLSDRPITLPTRTAIATIFPATLLPAANNDSTVLPETSLNHITSSAISTLSHEQKVEALKAKGFRFSVDHLTTDQFTQYRYLPTQQKIIQEQLDEWEQDGIIKEGTPTWTHDLVLVKKRPINPQLVACIMTTTRRMRRRHFNNRTTRQRRAP